MTKKEFLKSIIFCFLFVAILIPLSYALRTNGDVKDRFVGFYAEPKNTIDIVYIGSSPVYGAFNTPKLWGESGITSYALSSNVQRPAAAKYLVEEALKTQSPSLFVFEMRMFAMSDAEMMTNMAYTRGVTDNLKYSLNRINLINALVPSPTEREALVRSQAVATQNPTKKPEEDTQDAPADNAANPADLPGIDIDDMDRYTYYFDIFKYHSNWKTLALWSQLRTCLYEYPDDLKGYVPDFNIGNAVPFDAELVTETAAIPPEQERVLLDLLTYLNDHEIPALFVLVPEAMTAEKAALYNTIQKIVLDSGHDFLDMNEHYDEIGIAFSTDFADNGGHLNHNGADKITDFFKDYLLTHYSFTDKRGDSRYRSWDEAYLLWKKRIENNIQSDK